MNSYLWVFVVALVASLILTRWVRDFAKRHNWVDNPDAHRKLHREPIPRLGGIAIYLSVFVSFVALLFIRTLVSESFKADWKSLLFLMGLGALMMGIGLWDDLKNLSPWVKFSAQILVAIICWFVGFRILSGWTHVGTVSSIGALSLPLTVIWIVGVTNAFNLIDGIDGLSAGAALFAMIAMLVVSIANDLPISTILLCGLAGATLGFLRYNFNPASIFLGDSGSLFLGFMLSLLAIRSSQKSTTAFAIAVPIVAFGLPVLDTAVAIIRRFLSRKPIFEGDRGHIHHVLMARGLKPRNAVTLLYGVCGLFGLFSLLFMNPSGKTVGFALAILGACVWFGIQQLHYPELRELNAHFARGIQNQRRLIAGSVAIGKMLDGFQFAKNIPDLLNAISVTLNELEFSRAELRLQGIPSALMNPLPKEWGLSIEDHRFDVFRWNAASEAGGAAALDHDAVLDVMRKESNSLVVTGGGTDFKLEFLIHTPEWYIAPGIRSPRSLGGLDLHEMGTISFYHRDHIDYPVSAISLLSRNVWGEFEQALNRILSQYQADMNRSVQPAQKPLREAAKDWL